MHPRQETPAALTRLARHQAGVVTNAQALGLGLSRHAIARLIADRRWQRLAVGIMTTTPEPPSWEAMAWGGVLLGGPSARLGPAASAYLWQLDATPPDPVDVFTQRNVKADTPWRFIRETAGARSGANLGSPPRLAAADSVVDRAATLRSEGEVITLVTAALRLRITTITQLERALKLRGRHAHRGLLTKLLRDAIGIESGLELEFLREVERPHDLPIGTRQHPDPDRPYRTDVDYRPFRVIAELDGRLGHEGEGRFRDMSRDNYHALRDATTIRYGWWHVSDNPCRVAYQVYLALLMRGYGGLFGRCRRCVGLPEDCLSDLAG